MTIQLSDWCVTEQGQAQVRMDTQRLCLSTAPSPRQTYSNAQISDYADADFRWRPPLRMDIRAQFSSRHPVGTAGFGFWNHPFAPGEFKLRLPQAVWFFYSAPPSNMALALNVPGPGWKAATFNARRWQFLLLAPTAPLALLLMRIPSLYRRLWPVGQHAIGVSEALLEPDLMTQFHDYRLEWRRDGASFYVDGELVYEAPESPGGPLGFVAWIDNQYAIVTPQGHVEFGTVPIETEQALTIESVSIQPC